MERSIFCYGEKYPLIFKTKSFEVLINCLPVTARQTLPESRLILVHSLLPRGTNLNKLMQSPKLTCRRVNLRKCTGHKNFLMAMKIYFCPIENGIIFLFLNIYDNRKYISYTELIYSLHLS